MSSTVPGKTDFMFSVPDDSLLVQWVDTQTTLNIESKDGVMTEWLYDGTN